MAKWGSVDYEQFKRLNARLEKLQGIDFDKLANSLAKELAARLLRKVIRRTPVGQYPEESGMIGGTLRRGWTASSEEEALYSTIFGGSSGINKYLESMQVKKVGKNYEVTISNPVYYAPFVEYGHLKVNGGWVDGQFMLTISEQELEKEMPRIIERRIQKALKEVFEG